MKTCSKCRNHKDEKDFHPRHKRPEQLQSWCKACVLRLNREKYTKNPEPQKKAHKALYEKTKGRSYLLHRKWASKNPEKMRLYSRKSKLKALQERPDEMKDWYLRKTYGITLVQFDELMLSQGGCCALCEGESNLCVDHNHKTNAVRGLLCGNCNRAIGLLKDSPVFAQKASAYLS